MKQCVGIYESSRPTHTFHVTRVSPFPPAAMVPCLVPLTLGAPQLSFTLNKRSEICKYQPQKVTAHIFIHSHSSLWFFFFLLDVVHLLYICGSFCECALSEGEHVWSQVGCISWNLKSELLNKPIRTSRLHRCWLCFTLQVLWNVLFLRFYSHTDLLSQFKSLWH